jgi:hypothetical protein
MLEGKKHIAVDRCLGRGSNSASLITGGTADAAVDGWMFSSDIE